MKRIVRFLEEREGVRSMIRLQSLILFCFSLIMITVQVFLGRVYVELDATLLILSFAPKAIQKFAEAKMQSTANSQDENKEVENG